MSKCKIGDAPVNRLTREQCDKIIKKWYLRCHGHEWMGIFVDTNYYLRVKNRIQLYKENLTARGL